MGCKASACAKIQRLRGGTKFSRQNLFKHGIDIHKTHKDIIIWLKLDKNVFGFENNIYLAVVYITPEYSTHSTEDVFYIIQRDMANIPLDSDIIKAPCY